MTAEVDKWQGAWSRSVIGLCALGVIRRTQPTHGYAVISEIRTRLGTDTTGGVVYPLLNRLEAEGILTADWQPGDGGPGRKTYALTARGEQALLRLQSDWDTLNSAVADMMMNAGGTENE